MKSYGFKVFLLVSLVVLLFAGCTNRYIITQELEAKFPEEATCHIGDFTDELPDDVSMEKKPTIEDIEKFRKYIYEALQKSEVLKMLVKSPDNDYEIRGRILDYKKGSGFLRFIFSFLGNAKLTTALELYDNHTGRKVFAGNFTGKVSDWSVSGEKMYEIVAKDFSKALKKELKRLDKLEKNKEKE